MFSKITRSLTIAGGFAAAAILTAELFVDDQSSFREMSVFNFILVWSMAWFFANAVRFFDTRNELWLRFFGLLPLGLSLASWQRFDLTKRQIHQRNKPSETVRTVSRLCSLLP